MFKKGKGIDSDESSSEEEEVDLDDDLNRGPVRGKLNGYNTRIRC